MKVNAFEVTSGFLAVFLVALGTGNVLRDREDAKYAKHLTADGLFRIEQYRNITARKQAEFEEQEQRKAEMRKSMESNEAGQVLNTAIGVNAMQSITTGTNNTAIGYNAESEVSDGQFLLCLGDYSCSGPTPKGCSVDIRPNLTLGHPLTQAQIQDIERLVEDQNTHCNDGVDRLGIFHKWLKDNW